MIDRRTFLAGTAVAAMLPPGGALATPDADAALRATLDGLAGLGGPAAKLAMLAGVNEAGLSTGARLDLEIAREGLTIDARIAGVMPVGRLGRSPYTVTPSSGAWRDLTMADARDRIAADTAAIKVEAAAGVILPRDALDRTVAAMTRASVGATPAIAAALTEQIGLLTALQPRAGEPGVGRLPDGERYFGLMIDRQFGGSDPAAIHQRLLAKIKETTAEADQICARLGYQGATTGARLRTAFRDPRFLYADDDTGRNRAVVDMNGWLDRAKARVPALFGPLPAECMNVAVRRMTPAEEAARKSGYRTLPRPDGTPGRYFVDLADIHRRPSWSLGSVVHHELIPGHMIQMPLDARVDPHPIRADYTGGYAEGWAIYAEHLMARQGAFSDDDRARLGFLHWMLFRLGRAVIDTGVHYARWSVIEAQETLERMQGEPAYFATFDQDIQRVCLEPGARVGEALAWLALADLCGESAGPDPVRRHRAATVDGRLRLNALKRRVSDQSTRKSGS